MTGRGTGSSKTRPSTTETPGSALQVVLEPIDVNLLLSQAAGEYEDRMAEKNLTMVLDISSDPWRSSWIPNSSGMYSTIF